MKKLILLSEQKSFIRKPASADCIIGQENAFLKRGNGSVEIVYKSIILKNISRLIKKIGFEPLCDGFTRKKREDAVFMYIAMNLVYLKSNRYLLKKLKESGNELSLYIYDCWEPEFDAWQKVIDEIRPDYVFFCFKQTYEHYKDIYEKCYWVPQSADLDYFKDLGIEKTRRFIQMGRVNPKMHEAILNYLKDHNLEDQNDNYVYRRKEKTNLFPELPVLVREINRSKFIVCIPKCYENFKRTGNVSGITARYFESIACKTLIIGKKPVSFDDLFPSDGMIEFNEDLSDFGEKIDDLLEHPQKYQDIVDRNYECLMKYNTWGNRCDQIMSIINK
ncbi:MAG: glycosyltransferase [Erysipelotrichaceae bacterium]|nr:glycosyltransferase [Erysipelotrichaceae bacterium]